MVVGALKISLNQHNFLTKEFSRVLLYHASVSSEHTAHSPFWESSAFQCNERK